MSSGSLILNESLTLHGHNMVSDSTDIESPQPGLGFESVETNGQSSNIESFHYDRPRNSIIRMVRRRDGTVAESDLLVDPMNIVGSDLASAHDWAWMRSKREPKLRGVRRSVRLVDLFSGCGGMTLGVKEACRALGLRAKPLLAVDIDKTALEVYQRNISVERALSDPIESILDSDLGQRPSNAERKLKATLGHVDLLVGGPPCQGHSDLNNHTRRKDSRNSLFLKMARFAEICEPDHIVIENVLGVRYDTGNVFERTRQYLKFLGYHVDADIIRAEKVGVAQGRPRIFLVASKKVAVTVKGVITQFRTKPRSFMWACADLIGTGNGSSFDRPSTCQPITRERIDFLFDNNMYELPNHMRPECHRAQHTYPSVYGRIRPAEPAPTITTGFMVMGQGRFVHPEERRTLTPHEGARIQGFPDWFDFGERPRVAYETLIGNAVPPKLTYVMALELLR